MLCLVFLLCSATVDFSDWSRCMCFLCFLYFASIYFSVCPMYTLLRSQGIWYMLWTLRSKPYLTGLSMCTIFLFVICIVLIWCFTRSLLRPVLLLMTCLYGTVAVSVGSLSSNCDFCFGHRAHLMSLLLYPFCWKTCFGHCSSSLRLLGSHTAPSCWTTLASTAHFCARLCSGLV
jgi:hypothetical protein